jgi:WD40 repeat protein
VACLDENDIVELLEGVLPAERAQAVEDHIDECAACRQLLVELSRVSGECAAEVDTRTSSTVALDPGAVTPGEAPSELVPSVEGRYEFLGVRGSGGQGNVYRVYDKIMGREVAFKELSRGEPSSPGGTEEAGQTFKSQAANARFLREVRIAAQLAHPGIINVHELGRTEEGTLYYTMPFVRGRTLAEALSDTSTLDERLSLLGHFVDMCNAIAYSHSRGVLHRDLKPSNVMIGEFGETQLLDWGLAVAKASPESETTPHTPPETGADMETITGTTLGTPPYMSPEQADGRLADVDERSDVWSLGAVLYQLLTGRPPFEDARIVDGAVHRRPSPPPRQLCPEAPGELISICERALAVDKAARYPSARELAEDVQAYMAGRRVAAYEYSAVELLRRFAARYRTPLLVLAVATGVLVTFGVAAYLRVVRERNRATNAEHSALHGLAETQQEGARAALARGDLLEARARLRTSLEIDDSVEGRALWRTLARNPLVWRRKARCGPEPVSYNTDGVTIAMGCAADRSVYLFDARTGRIARILRGHEDQVQALAFSPDGKRLASGDRSGQVIIWRRGDSGWLMSRKERTIRAHQDNVLEIAFHPEGAVLATACQDGSIRTFRVNDGRRLRQLRSSGAVLDVAFSPDGTLLASAGMEGAVRIWDAGSGRQRHAFDGPTGSIYTLAFSPDGRRLVAGGQDRRIWVWDPRTRAQPLKLQHEAMVYDLAFSPDGKHLAAGCRNGEIRIWREAALRGGRLERPYLSLMHSGAVRSLAFSPKGDALASVSFGFHIWLWNLDTKLRQPRPRKLPHQADLNTMAISNDGTLLALGGWGDHVYLVDAQSGANARPLGGHTGRVFGLAFSPDDSLLASGSYDRTVRIWDARTGRTTRILTGHGATIYTAAFAPKGELLATGSSDKTIRLWDPRSGATVRVLRGHAGPVRDIDFSPDGRYLASASFDGSARIWAMPTGRLVRTITGHGGAVYSARFGPGGRILATGGADRTARVWDIRTGKLRAQRKVSSRIHWLDVHPDGRRVGLPTAAGVAWIWDFERETVTDLIGHRQAVNMLRFGPDGRHTATVSDDTTVRLWTTDTGVPAWRAPFLFPDGPVFLSHEGWRSFAGKAAPPTPRRRWHAAVEQTARLAAVLGPRAICIATWDGYLELWDRRDDRRLARRRRPGLRRLVATSDGCLSLDVVGRVVLDRPGGEQTLVPEGGTALATDQRRGTLLVATSENLLVFTETGERSRSSKIDDGVTALTPLADGVILGFADGAIEVVRRAARRHVEGTLPSPVESLLLGPRGTLVAGYVDGNVGLFGLDSAKRLDHARINGPVTHLLLQGTQLYAISELGDHLAWDLAALDVGYCHLLEQIRSRVPLVWAGGRAKLAPGSRGNRCNPRR